MRRFVVAILLVGAVLGAYGAALSRLNLSPRGQQAVKATGSPAAVISMSVDGRYVAYDSEARNLVDGDTNGRADIFVWDRATGRNTRVSMTNNDLELDGDSTQAAISADGRYVAFVSTSKQLAVEDKNDAADIFVWDRSSKKAVRASVATDGAEANGPSSYPVLSADGRYVAFLSDATNLVLGDANDCTDVFVRDLRAGTTVRVSVSSAGVQGNDRSYAPLAITPDGRNVAFSADAANLVAGDTNKKTDLFIHDQKTHVTMRVSPLRDTQPIGRAGDPAFSPDGRYLAFSAETTAGRGPDIFVLDGRTGAVECVSLAPGNKPANGGSVHPSISADGRLVVFRSFAANLVSGDTNGKADIFLADRTTRQITRINVAADGAQADGDSAAPTISATGRYAAFCTDATNLLREDTNDVWDLYAYDRGSDAATLPAARPTPEPPATTEPPPPPPTTVDPKIPVTLVSRRDAGDVGNAISALPTVTPDGRYVAFVSNAHNLVGNDGNGCSDVFVRDLTTHRVERVSVNSSGEEGNGASGASGVAISADGRYVAFASAAANLVANDANGCADIFVRDRVRGVTARVSVDSNGVPGNGESRSPSISADGRYVAFMSSASTLVPGDTNGHPDIFVRDTVGKETYRVSATLARQANDWCAQPAISSDGRFVVFTSAATNLVAGDTNGVADVFLYTLDRGTLTRVSQAGETGANGECGAPAISADGRYIVFHAAADNLVPGDTNRQSDIFAVDRTTWAVERLSVVGASRQGNGASYNPAISPDGRYVAFISAADNLTAGDTNRGADVLLRDRTTGALTRLSPAVVDAYVPTLALNARIAAFVTPVALVTDDKNTVGDVYLVAR
jgi:Tol biopolymer transport system component